MPATFLAMYSGRPPAFAFLSPQDWMSCGPTKERVCVPGQLLLCPGRSAQIFRFPPGLESIQTAGCHHRWRFPHMFLTLHGIELTPPAATREGLAPQ